MVSPRVEDVEGWVEQSGDFWPLSYHISPKQCAYVHLFIVNVGKCTSL